MLFINLFYFVLFHFVSGMLFCTVFIVDSHRQDETKYYNDYLQSLSKALARHKAEEIILNKIKAPGAELESFPGIVEVGPTYHFR